MKNQFNNTPIYFIEKFAVASWLLKVAKSKICRALCARIINVFPTDIKLGLTIHRLLPVPLPGMENGIAPLLYHMAT